MQSPVALEHRPHARGPRAVEPSARARPEVRGKFIFVGEEKLYMKGVAYGPFQPGKHGEYHDAETVARDFSAMAGAGINTVRTYTLPPRWLLDVALEHGLRVMVGLAWEQHVAFLADRQRPRRIERKLREQVRTCADHPAVLCSTIGNEIPAHIVRWHGHRKIERFLKRLYLAAKDEDPQGLVTYVNYPSTEYLDLPFLDFVSFNVYLESQRQLEGYTARLANIAGERPLVMAEMGMDSLRHGEAKQAETLDWQVRAAFAGGCAGVVVFSWTDEWFRGGSEIHDWAFGLTTRERIARPALSAVCAAFAHSPLSVSHDAPGVSVIICTHNGERTLEQCLSRTAKLTYPAYEVIVVNDGSTDQSAPIARRFGVRLISTPNRGLSAARNEGLAAARHPIVAYLDDDAWPDPHWLHYLARSLTTSAHVGVGGPNIVPRDDRFIAQCVARAPGGPTQVLLTDQQAEHIPGCNMAFRRDALKAVGGFDPRFRIAGDDVDLCWRLQDRGGTLGFNPAAVVWHRRRPTLWRYWKQQFNYGRAEALLERKWPEKFNAAGHLTWSGRIYDKGFFQSLAFLSVRRIYHGQWGAALFQSVYHVPPSVAWSIAMMPEWYMLIAVLALVCALGFLWPPLGLVIPVLGLATAAPLLQALLSTRRSIARGQRAFPARGSAFVLTTLLHLLQPAARLTGRLRCGLTPWRWRAGIHFLFPCPREMTIWSENWHRADARLCGMEDELRGKKAAVYRGGDFDRWDIEVRRGVLGAARIYMTVEEHGEGRQLTRIRALPRARWLALLVCPILLMAAGIAVLDRAHIVAAILAVPAMLLVLRTLHETGSSLAAIMTAARSLDHEQRERRSAAAAPADVSPRFDSAAAANDSLAISPAPV